MRLKNIPGAKEDVQKSEYVIQCGPQGCYYFPTEILKSCSEPCVSKEAPIARIDSAVIFGNENPLRIEIGMGKGDFLIETAEQNPEVNFIGIEKYSSVLVRAVQKLERRTDASEPKPSNIRLLCADAERICEFFAPQSTERIYLNFSDPWPKARHAKRRLTSKSFLEKYRVILKKSGTVEFKTDNPQLFAFSVDEARSCGWKILAETIDLHKSAMARENIMTEYEKKFSAMGKPICKMIILPPDY